MKKIYFDMDGVLADFDKSADAIFPRTINLNLSGSDLADQLRLQKQERWKRIEASPYFWRDIPQIPNVIELLNIADKMGELFILSKTPATKYFSTGETYTNFVVAEKKNWVLKNFAKYFKEQNIIITNIDKDKLIKPTINDILIDDRIQNITKWRNAGGTGILFTSPQDTISALSDFK